MQSTFGLFAPVLLEVGVIAGTTPPKHRIVSGTAAVDGQTLYQISLQTLPGDHRCGGAIIADRWILTAGHYVSGWPADYLRVATGTLLYREPGAFYYPDAVHLHCNYNTPLYHSDLAMLHLNSTIVYDERTRAIAIENCSPTEDLLFTVWGSTEMWRPTPERLQLDVVARGQCAELLSTYDDLQLDVGHNCAFSTTSRGTCFFDNGGPLVSANGTIVGVQGWSAPCAKGVSDVFASVRFYDDWMRRVMSGNGRC